MMKATAYSLLLAAAAVAACKPREPVEEMTFERLEKIYQQCAEAGKIQTDNQCKEVASVYEQKEQAVLEQRRLDKLKTEKYPTQ